MEKCPNRPKDIYEDWICLCHVTFPTNWINGWIGEIATKKANARCPLSPGERVSLIRELEDMANRNYRMWLDTQ